MTKKLRTIVAALLVSAGLGAAVAAPVAYAAPADEVQKGINLAGGGSGSTDAGDIISLIVKVLMFIIGAISVIMIIVGGIRYTISQGDSSAVTSAKNTILYSIIGLVVAILAYAAVKFVVGSFAANQ